MRLDSQTHSVETREVVLLFSRRDDLMQALSRSTLAEAAARDYILVKPGEIFRRLGERIYQIRPAEPDDYRRLLDAFRGRPLRVLFFWNYDASPVDYVFHGNAPRLLSHLRLNLVTGFDAICRLKDALQGSAAGVP